MVDFTPLRMEFLWVCWYEPIEQVSSWDSSTLDQLRFCPIDDGSAFSFMDPADVLRNCHIIPAFAKGKKHPDGLGVSGQAGDKDDWRGYYVNRFVDRDMLMHFHFGLGMGHVYSHYRLMHVGLKEGSSNVEHHAENGIEEEYKEYKGKSESEGEDEEREDDGTISGLTLEQHFGASSESLTHFNDMYDSELELDYEN
ncbi:uncharacterized protein EDB93DRAFT_1245012 [Suillus bovinus]|uniref:uncharacterized protein n=1 Tax=Suillus bovinus TaxID=48563 RepID=UPI001B85CD29|nr:uncharacterized protein EDB93DRAFT_1245012 [Suillus bovinus]KAG2159196.1 hypothetical protein EDB93DRAFT_1245012 [Suillus bovinus]